MRSNLQDRYCIVGIGETDYSRGSGEARGRSRPRPSSRDGRRRLDSQGRRRDAQLSRRRLDHFVRPRLRHGHQAQLLHGLLRRRVEHRGAGRARNRRDRGGHVRDGGDIPLDERLLAGPNRRHRLKGVGAGFICGSAAPVPTGSPALSRTSPSHSHAT